MKMFCIIIDIVKKKTKEKRGIHHEVRDDRPW